MAVPPIAPIAPGIPAVAPAAPAALPKNAFEDILAKAVDALEGVSQVENQANLLITQYAAGRVELSEVMIATAKMSVAVQLAVTTITTAVNTFKEITQMPV